MLERPVVFLVSRLGPESGVRLRCAGLVLWSLLLLGLFSLAGVALAEQGILVVQVSDPAGRPLEGLVIGVGGDGGMARTDSHGKARIALPKDTTEGSPVTLLLGPQDASPGEEWVFRSPDGGTANVPSFDRKPQNFVRVVLETRKERDEIAAIVDRLVASRTAEVRARELELEEQNKSLTEAVRALATQRDQPDPPAGIDEALELLAAGNTEAAEAIFQDVAERKTSESDAARLEAAAAWRHLGALAFFHDTEKALDAYRQAVALEPENAVGWNRLGHLLQRVGELDEAESAYRKVLEMGESSAERDLVAVAYGNLGLIYQTRGDLEEAESLLRQALALNEELNRKEGMARTYGSLGVINQIRGDLEEAELLLRQALALNQELGSKEGMAIQYGNLGLIHQTRGDLEEAESLHRQALALDEELGSKGGMAIQYSNLGKIYQTRGDQEEAESLLRQALALDEELGSKEGMASTYGSLGVIYQIRGDLAEAESLHRQSLALNEELGSKEGMASQYGNLGLIYQTRGDLEEAESLHRQALALDEELGSKEGMARQYANLGKIYWIRGDLEEAESLLRQSLALSKPLGSKEGMAITYANLGKIYQTRGDLEEARRLWERSLDLFRELGASPLVERVQGLIDGLDRTEGE